MPWANIFVICGLSASMKVPPKRKGNNLPMGAVDADLQGLNESPSEKEGKFGRAKTPPVYPQAPQ